MPPKLHVTHPDKDANQQYHAFNRAKAMVGTFSTLQILFKNDGSMVLAPLGEALLVVEGKDAEEGTGPEATSIWKALPVHPKVAALFMGGIPVQEALYLFKSIYAMVPDAVKTNTEGLMMYGCLATIPLADGTSVLDNTLARMDLAELEELEEWYCSIVDLYAPVGITPRAPAPPPIYPVDLPRNEDNTRALDLN